MNMEFFGDRLKSLRKGKGLTQSQLAKRIGLVSGTVSAYEQGLKYPSIEVLIKICSSLDSSSDYLLGLSDRMPFEMGGLSQEQNAALMLMISSMERLNNLEDKLKK